MNKKSCKEGLDIYKKFITRMDRVSDFLKVAEDVGFDKDDIPDLSKVGWVCHNKDFIISCSIDIFCSIQLIILL